MMNQRLCKLELNQARLTSCSAGPAAPAALPLKAPPRSALYRATIALAYPSATLATLEFRPSAMT